MQFSYKNTTGLTDSEIQKTGEVLIPYIENIKDIILHETYESPEASINLPSETEFLEQSKQMAQKFSNPNLKLVIVIGIGGSNLGTKAIYDALYGYFSDIKPKNKLKVLFLDTINQSYIAQLAEYISHNKIQPDEYVVNVVTKSGTTSETIVNLELLLTMLPSALDRIVVTTDNNSMLDQAARTKDIEVLNIPKNVGGRFSVFSNVGLFPLTLLGFDCSRLLEGALDAREKNTSIDIIYNPSAVSAIILYILNKKGYVINDNFFFNSELESIGKWYRQLMGESIGKNGKGLTPTVSIGSTDLHSVAQLYLGGPKNKYFTFYWSPLNTSVPASTLTVPNQPVLDGLVPDIQNKSATYVLQIILTGVKQAFKKKGIPYSDFEMEEISEYSLGKFMQLKMIEMMYLGKLFEINTFDQPNVEEYKKETRRLMRS